MFSKSALIVILAAFIGSTLAVEFIEFNDHNNDLLALEISKPFWFVQDALKNGFKFEKVDDVVKFLDYYKSLNEALGKEEDTEFEGLAGKMKAVLQDPQLVKLSSIPRQEFNKFVLLDSPDMGENLTSRRVNELVELGKLIVSNADVKTVLGYLYEKITTKMADTLLKTAGEDTTTFFGDERKGGLFDLGSIYNSGCAITQLKPLCKLIRNTNADDVSALGDDVVLFSKALQSNDKEFLDKHVQTSGVTLNNLEESCKSARGSFHAMKVMDSYLENDFLSEAQIEEQNKVEPYFYLYRELYKLCKVVAK